jgi:aldehyde dehydrogenase family 7 protein A1
MSAPAAKPGYEFLEALGLADAAPGVWDGESWCGDAESLLVSQNPANGEDVLSVKQATPEMYEKCIENMIKARDEWMMTPAPKRGEVVRAIGVALRAKKAELGELVAMEMGKIRAEGEGEVQEAIDICDLAVGLSRCINGAVIPSERHEHALLECYSPLGLVGIVTAFNFPCAVLFWNLAISMICGNCNIWKGASTTPLVTMACTKIVVDVLKEQGVPTAVLTTVTGPGRTIGQRLIEDERLKLVSFTGSSEIGTTVSRVVHERFGRTILELGGNNASIVMPDADLEMVVRGSLFGAVGTAGQRCTTLRRLIIHESVYDEVVSRLVRAYKTVKIGDPREEGVLMGPLHTAAAVREYTEGLEAIKAQGGKILTGGNPLPELLGGYHVEPTIVEIDHTAEIVKTELFVPILYVLKFGTIEEAIAINNEVPQGLSSSMYTKDVGALFKWIGPCGSDCGIVNLNCGTSGAEIGGAFGGEKATGGGRESGSDAWKQYMRRTTCTLNYSTALPLAQGIKFE